MNVLDIWKIIFARRKYLIISLLVASAFYLINVIIANYKTLFSFYPSSGFLKSLTLLFSLSFGFYQAIALHSFITLILSSVLLGMVFSIIIFKINIQSGSELKNDKKTKIFGSVGVFLAALAPGCAACGLGLAAILGLSGAFLVALPLKGLEISILAIAILSLTAWKVSKNMLECDSCKTIKNS